MGLVARAGVQGRGRAGVGQGHGGRQATGAATRRDEPLNVIAYILLSIMRGAHYVLRPSDSIL